jgi:hypothetical protein
MYYIHNESENEGCITVIGETMTGGWRLPEQCNTCQDEESITSTLDAKLMIMEQTARINVLSCTDGFAHLTEREGEASRESSYMFADSPIFRIRAIITI